MFTIFISQLAPIGEAPIGKEVSIAPSALNSLHLMPMSNAYTTTSMVSTQL